MNLDLVDSCHPTFGREVKIKGIVFTKYPGVLSGNCQTAPIGPKVRQKVKHSLPLVWFGLVWFGSLFLGTSHLEHPTQ
jgi:hypothetical protein